MLKNKHEVSKFYQTDDPNAELMPLEYTKKSPIKYVIEKPDKKYIIFTENYNENWKLGKQQPLQLNAVNTYEFKGEQILNYKRFNIYLLSYIMPALAFVSLLFGLMRR